ncbi:MAG TPA: 30S ribosomal protein THX [Allocoleopsis sp.]
MKPITLRFVFDYKLNFKKYLNMGKGDKRSKRGKIFKGSYGKSRPTKKAAKAAAPAA